jgi:hypothetical protein
MTLYSGHKYLQGIYLVEINAEGDEEKIKEV